METKGFEYCVNTADKIVKMLGPDTSYADLCSITSFVLDTMKDTVGSTVQEMLKSMMDADRAANDFIEKITSIEIKIK